MSKKMRENSYWNWQNRWKNAETFIIIEFVFYRIANYEKNIQNSLRRVRKSFKVDKVDPKSGQF